MIVNKEYFFLKTWLKQEHFEMEEGVIGLLFAIFGGMACAIVGILILGMIGLLMWWLAYDIWEKRKFRRDFNAYVDTFKKMGTGKSSQKHIP